VLSVATLSISLNIEVKKLWNSTTLSSPNNRLGTITHSNGDRNSINDDFVSFHLMNLFHLVTAGFPISSIVVMPVVSKVVSTVYVQPDI
jgi:hypothetical protein